MTRPVSELTGADLALCVARAEGLDAEVRSYEMADGRHYYCNVRTLTRNYPFSPHEDWAQGGPIIKRHNISLHPPTSPVHRCGGLNAGAGQSGVWTATTWTKGANGRRAVGMDDHSPLVAAMRCYVRFVFGDTVQDEVTS